jgi:CRP-like cAMP-binding protein
MDDRSVLAGNLTFINLADIFQILGGSSSTGILRIASKHSPDPGLIHFIKGDPVNATIGSQSGIDALYALFGWVEGAFEFHEQEVRTKRVINRSRMEIVLDAMRMLDDGLIKKVGPPSFDEIAAEKADKGRSEKRRVIEGPLLDYSYVLNEEHYRDGENIVRESGHGKWIWVILKGSVTISRETSKGLMTIAHLGRGCFLGTFAALTFMEYTRSATIAASGDVQLGLLDTELLHREFSSLSPEFKGFLVSLDRRLRKITDRTCELFANKDKADKLPKDSKVVVEKGSSKKEAFSIVEGEAYVIGQTRKGSLPLVTLETNDVFGYIPFMDMGQEPRYASVFSSKDLKVNRLDATHFQKEYDQLSDTIRNMIYVTCTCIFSTTKLASALYEGR